MRLAEHDGVVVAFAAFSPAEPRPDLSTPAAGTAHVWAVFVTRSHWGSGVAGALLGQAVDAMVQRGFRRGRLVTPALQARARRFYEREGWREVGGPFHEPLLTLDLVEFVREW